MKTYILYCDDCMKRLPKLPAASVDLIFADPPYFLSNGGITCKGGKMVTVDKADWDKKEGLKDIHTFNRKWIRRCYRVLKDTGSIFISGTFHNIYSIGMALQQENFTIVNNITWQKLNPPPNLACKTFTHSTETVVWAVKNKKKYFFNYQLMKSLNGDKQMKDVWSGPLTPQKEKQFGKHPTQKPEYLLEKIILSASKEDDTILDPFTGSSTTGVVAIRHRRKFIGIDNVQEYIDISQRRLDNERL